MQSSIKCKYVSLCVLFCVFLTSFFNLAAIADVIPSSYDWATNPGTGDSNNPYQIATADQLISLGATPSLWDQCFVLTADLTFAPDSGGDPNYCNFNIIGNEALPFSGSFDGQGHQIENLVFSGSDDNIALFGYSQPTAGQQVSISNLILVNPVISSINNIGALAGYAENTIIENCHVVGGAVSGVDGVGGLVGWSVDSPIAMCSATAAISGHESVGGLVGYYESAQEQIFSSFTTGDVLGQSMVGGLVGYLYNATIESCYATGAVVGDDVAGCLVGCNDEGIISRCYANGSITVNTGFSFGLIGDCYCDDYGEKGVAFDSYWDTQTSGIPFSPYGIAIDVTGIGLTTDQMKSADFYGVWGNGQWVIDDGNDYPHLICEGTPGEPVVMYGGGSGTPEDPYLITGPGHLFALSYSREDSDKHFALANDIIWDPNLFYYSIGFLYLPFTGTFDGRGHQIEDFTINDGYGWIYGLFGHVQSVGGQSAVIKDLILTNPVISGDNFAQRGSLVSYAENAIIENCHVIGGAVSGNIYIGGLIGYNKGSSITMCSSTAAVNGNRYVGGLVGKNIESQILTSYAAGAVTGQECVGGLVGMGQGVIKNCYALGSVTGVSGVGGLLGELGGELWYCYAAGAVTGDDHTGGLYGQSSSINMLTSCFWDVQTTGIPAGYYGSPRAKMTAQMKSRYTYGGWGNGQWMIDDGVDYPHLVWEETEGTLIDNVPPAYTGGSGTVNDPYQISTAQELFTIGYYLPHLDKHFVLTDDIVVTPVDNPFPIGTEDYPFTGSLDGQGHEIQNLVITMADDAIGLFGYVQSNDSNMVVIEIFIWSIRL